MTTLLSRKSLPPSESAAAPAWWRVGMVWLVELIARGWFAENFGKYFLVFMGALMADHPDLIANHISLFVLSLALLLSSMALLRRQERYI